MPELKRYIYRIYSLSLIFAFPMLDGYAHPAAGSRPDRHWWKAKYPDQSFYVVCAYDCSPSSDDGFDGKELIFTFDDIFSHKEESGTACGLMYKQDGQTDGWEPVQYERIPAS